MDGLDLCLAVLKINQNELTLGPYRQTLADNTSDWFSSLCEPQWYGSGLTWAYCHAIPSPFPSYHPQWY